MAENQGGEAARGILAESVQNSCRNVAVEVVKRGRQSDHERRIRAELQKGFTVPEVSKRLNIPVRTVSYHAKKWRENGARIVADELLPKVAPVDNFGKNSARIRLHDFTLTLRLREGSPKLRRLLKRGNVLRVMGHRAEFFRDRVIVRAERGFSVSAVSVALAVDASFEYWCNWIQKLESRSGAVLLKRDDVLLWTYEVAEVDNELARDSSRRSEKIRVRDPLDGKTWLLVDKSTGLPELEGVDARESRVDMEHVVGRFFNDLRGNKELPLASEMALLLAEASRLQLEAARERVETQRALADLARAQRLHVETVLAQAGVSSPVSGLTPDQVELRRYTG